MEAKKKSQAKPAEPTTGPVKVFRIDDVSVSVFARERQYNGKPTTFHSMSFTRSYKASSGERKYTKNFDTEDLGKIVALCQQASEYIHSLSEAGPTVN